MPEDGEECVYSMYIIKPNSRPRPEIKMKLLQANSIFHMKRPFDLVSFMAQEARAERLEALRPADDEPLTSHLSWTASSTSAGSRVHADCLKSSLLFGPPRPPP